ncbi:RNA polymerase recycling motor HelD [Clostridium tarantellae]|uniref:AAA family ATPase n=1 Tax=Clostridium tarantellae TaxID=39493 RepID=A0A6I1MIS6_9CLOT|nr:RNA polymerase recycling motor HelD [Clostridium tarantellae]MPQ43275.1 AAA family ATPase [Clostridium tarantellae]
MSEDIVLKLEKIKLEETKQWIKEELNRIGEDNGSLLNKINDLEKAAKGAYNEELEVSKKLFNIVHKNLEKYDEAYIKPYFARVDFREYKKDVESFYIGKFGLGDITKGEEKVIDWRAPIADLYYSGTQGEAYYKAPVGVIEGELKLKRKFLYEEDNLSKYFDEGINEIILKSQLDEEGNGALIDEFLKINLESSTGSKLKEVVATIQKEQNEVIRAAKNFPLVIQGSAGSGKTTVALHRLAYLLYRYKESLMTKDILVIAPNKLFLNYISEVLPNLGVDKIAQKTFEEIALEKLGIKSKVITKDKKLINFLENKDHKASEYILNESKLKGSLDFKNILDNYLKILEREDSNIQDIKVMGYKLFDSSEIKRLFTKDLVKYPINKRKDEIKRYLYLKVNDKVKNILDKVDFQFEYKIARIKKQMEDCKERREKLIALYDERDNHKKQIQIAFKKEYNEYFDNWKGINTTNVYNNFFKRKDIYDEATEDKISLKLISDMKNKFEENLNENLIDCDDLAAMLYLKFKIEGMNERELLKHIVVDEAQDYSPLQLKVISMMTLGNSLTIVGDLGQGIYSYRSIEHWNMLLKDIYNNKALYKKLTQSYRSTVEIINFANKVLKKQKYFETPANPVLRHGDEPKLIEFKNGKDFCEQVDIIIDKMKNKDKHSIAIIGKTLKECKKIKEATRKYSKYKFNLVKDDNKDFNFKIIIIPSYLTKGLEFDCSIVYNLNSEFYKDSEIDKKLLYVVLTRALHYEYIFYNGQISPLIE